MLRFFKKTGHKDKSVSPASPPTKYAGLNKSVGDGVAGSLRPVQPSLLCSLEEEEEEDNYDDKGLEICNFHSQLSKTMPEILADKSALGYFIQYMESRGEILLIKFWLEVECLSGAVSNLKSSCSSLNLPICTCNTITNETIDMNVNSNEPILNCETPKNIEVANDKSQHINSKLCQKDCETSTLFQDALRIYRKYIVKDLLGPNRLSEDLKIEIENALKSNNLEPLLQSLLSVQRIVYKILEDEFMNDFIRSDFHCKHQIDVLTSENVQLADILYDESAFFYFMEFMEIEHKRELLDFWMSVLSYKQNLLQKGDSADPTEAQADALIIYDKYFSLQATMSLGFSDQIRFQVEQNICREDGRGPQPDCFDRPCQIVYNYLNRRYFSAFLSSQLFYKYLSEMINTVQSNSYSVSHPAIKRTGSDCSSDVCSYNNSISSRLSTVCDDKKHPKCESRSMNGGMNIDLKHLNDPDSLWKRSKSSLSVGYVDSLGRFVTEIEPDPYRKHDKSRISRAVKRLVHLEQDEAKEESAWKIAEMIVRDVTSLTLGESVLPP